LKEKDLPIDKNFTRVQKRIIQHWFVDGLAVLAESLVSLFLAVLFGICQVVFTWRWSRPVILVAVFAVLFGLRLII